MKQELQYPRYLKHKPACALNHGGEWCDCKSTHQAVAEAVQKSHDRRTGKKRCDH